MDEGTAANKVLQQIDGIDCNLMIATGDHKWLLKKAKAIPGAELWKRDGKRPKR